MGHYAPDGRWVEPTPEEIEDRRENARLWLIAQGKDPDKHLLPPRVQMAAYPPYPGQAG